MLSIAQIVEQYNDLGLRHLSSTGFTLALLQEPKALPLHSTITDTLHHPTLSQLRVEGNQRKTKQVSFFP